MKRTIAILLAFLLVISLAACGGWSTTTPTPELTPEATPELTPEPKPTKEELLEISSSIKKKDLDKAYSNSAYAKSLEGNTYKFDGWVASIEADYLEIMISSTIQTEPSNYTARVYLPAEELIKLEKTQWISFVGTLGEVGSYEEEHGGYYGYDYTSTETLFVFYDAAIVTERVMKKIGTLDSELGSNAWYVLLPDGTKKVFTFTEDASSYIGNNVNLMYKCKSAWSSSSSSYVWELYDAIATLDTGED